MIEDYAKPKQTEKEKAENSNSEWYIELKYDGTRQFLISTETKNKLFNKRGTEKTRHFPDITENLKLPEGTVLDGETIVTDDLHPHGNKSVLQKRDGGKPVIRKSGKKNFKQKMKMKQYPAKFVAFDVLRYKGQSVRDKTIEERRKLLEEIVENTVDCLWKAQRFDSIGEGWKQVKAKKMEGLIVKKPNSRYPEGRTAKWKKVKNIKDTVLTCSEYEEHDKGITVIGEDNHDDNHRVTVNGRIHKKVKDAIDDEDEAEVEVSYLERSKNGKLREPTFKRLKA